MRFIFTVLFLVSFGSVSMGDLGDVYVCESVQNIDVSHLKIADNRKLKFKFMVLDRFINFSRDSNPGHFLGLRLPLTEKHDGILSGSEAPYTWELNDRSEPARFYYTETSTLGIIVTVAFCSEEKF